VDGDPEVEIEMHIFFESKAPRDHIGGDAPQFSENQAITEVRRRAWKRSIFSMESIIGTLFRTSMLRAPRLRDRGLLEDEVTSEQEDAEEGTKGDPVPPG